MRAVDHIAGEVVAFDANGERKTAPVVTERERVGEGRIVVSHHLREPPSVESLRRAHFFVEGIHEGSPSTIGGEVEVVVPNVRSKVFSLSAKDERSVNRSATAESTAGDASREDRHVIRGGLDGAIAPCLDHGVALAKRPFALDGAFVNRCNVLGGRGTECGENAERSNSSPHT